MHLEGVVASSEKETTSGEIECQDLVCPVCMTIAEDPYITSCCRRVFCQKDADQTKYENGCPLCRDARYTFQASSEHKSAVNKLTTKCSCSERIPPKELENHKERCSSVTFACPHSTCQEKKDCRIYNSAELVGHLARAHCDEVPILGDTFINKKDVESLQQASDKYDNLLAALYSELYPQMIDIHLKLAPNLKDTSRVFKCSRGHVLTSANSNDRKRKNGVPYSTPGFNCDKCHHSFTQGTSWHCSCTNTGYDKCVSCVVFELYNIENQVLRQACQDNEEQQHRYRQPAAHNNFHLPHNLFRLLSGHMDDDDDNVLTIPHPASFLRHTHSFVAPQDVESDDDEIEE